MLVLVRYEAQETLSAPNADGALTGTNRRAESTQEEVFSHSISTGQRQANHVAASLPSGRQSLLIPCHREHSVQIYDGAHDGLPYPNLHAQTGSEMGE